MSRPTASAEILSDRIRRIVIEQSKRADVGHIGSSLSVADILGVLFAGVLQGDGPDDPDRERFVLSKGHAGLALYAALHETGVIDGDELASFCADGSRARHAPRPRPARRRLLHRLARARALARPPAPRSPRASRGAGGARSRC